MLFYAAPPMLFFGAFIMRYRMETIFAFPFIALLAVCCTVLALTSFVHMRWLAQLFPGSGDH